MNRARKTDHQQQQQNRRTIAQIRITNIETFLMAGKGFIPYEYEMYGVWLRVCVCVEIEPRENVYGVCVCVCGGMAYLLFVWICMGCFVEQFAANKRQTGFCDVWMYGIPISSIHRMQWEFECMWCVLDGWKRARSHGVRTQEKQEIHTKTITIFNHNSKSCKNTTTVSQLCSHTEC